MNVRTRLLLIEVDSLGDEGLESPEIVIFKSLIENLYNIITHETSNENVILVESDFRKITRLARV